MEAGISVDDPIIIGWEDYALCQGSSCCTTETIARSGLDSELPVVVASPLSTRSLLLDPSEVAALRRRQAGWEELRRARREEHEITQRARLTRETVTVEPPPPVVVFSSALSRDVCY